MNKEKSNLSTAIWIAFWIIVLVGVIMFFEVWCPLAIYDTDDWTYLAPVRTSKWFPSVREWNPIKVLPENLMPFAASVGVRFFMPFSGNFVKSVNDGCALIIALLVFSYFYLSIRVLSKKFELDIISGIILSVFFIFVHFLPFIGKGEIVDNLFTAGNVCTYYNYTAATLVNIITVLIMIIHEDKMRDSSSSPLYFYINKVVLLILVYLSINSNLFCGVIIAAYSFVKIIQYIFVERRDCMTSTSHRITDSVIYIFTLILFFGSMCFEINGGRAAQIGNGSLNITEYIRAIISTFVNKNILFIILMSISFAGGIAAIVYALRYRKEYIHTLDIKIVNKMTRYNKKKVKKTRDVLSSNIETIDENSLKYHVIKYANYAALFMTCAIGIMIFITLLCAKINSGYVNSANVQLEWYFFFCHSFR